MRHQHGLRKLNRTTSHRLAMFRNMANSLFKHEAIKTTLPKAKELRRIVEPLITVAKNPTVANKRLVFNRLRDRDMVVKLFDKIGPMFKDRKGGYTRILKMGFRVGDNAPMAYIELVQKTAEIQAEGNQEQTSAPETAKVEPIQNQEVKAETPVAETTPEAETKTEPAKEEQKPVETEEVKVETPPAAEATSEAEPEKKPETK